MHQALILAAAPGIAPESIPVAIAMREKQQSEERQPVERDWLDAEPASAVFARDVRVENAESRGAARAWARATGNCGRRLARLRAAPHGAMMLVQQGAAEE
jgi:hypothetical protein